MPGPTPVPVTPDAFAQARAADIVVIGGGIVGASTALELAERGYKVVLCEKGEIGAEQSSRNWGWVRLTQRDPREMQLMVESVRLWQDLDTRIGGDTGYRRCGITFACATKADLDVMEPWLARLKEHQLPARLASAKEALAPFPGLDVDIAGALVNEADGRAEPQKAASAIAIGAQRLGAKILTNTAVRTVETTGGKVSAVLTEHGRIDCGAVVVAGGAWSRLFLGNLGHRLPQLRLRNTVLRTAPVPGGPEMTFKHPDFTLRKRDDGGYTIASVLANRYAITLDSMRLMRAFIPAIRNEWRTLKFTVNGDLIDELKRKRHWSGDERSPFEDVRILDPKPEEKAIRAILTNLEKAWPIFAGVKVEQTWAGMIDVTPDAVPVISPVEATPGLFLATGFSGHGFGLGPAAGRLAADLVTGAAPLVDPHAFRFGRFFDGTPMTPVSGVARR
ncbi:FAD-binding oxidoreductase [Acuticoccus sp. M5D2P5]|uniref:NAD(P)/FAD-dependent oxidoreductase n=1 Tax=Acuticoccus kalidii TaxID=2910977 RepID=UPI001F21A841|nr:FAD-binding oxidoreductase [Acuticoccus kalidii]MCF3935194.1 FAD-binding oxidoreductase [Acuticoccus kalidii]